MSDITNNDELKARSVELAERAFRLRDRAEDTPTKEKLHNAGNELVLIDNRQRFYDAQRILEQGDAWTEDQRALAHELNVADRTYRGNNSISFEDARQFIETLVATTTNSRPNGIDELTEKLSQHFRTLTVSNDEQRRKVAIDFILSYIEEGLQHSHNEEGIKNEMTDPIVLTLRGIRDSLLVHRELLFDENELMNTYQNEGAQIERLGLARHQLDQLYAAADH